MEPLPTPAPTSSARSRRRVSTVRTPTGLRLNQRFGAIWSRRDVIWMFVVRGLKVKYASSVLGYAWSLIEPALMIGIYFIVFGHIFPARGHIPNYPLFLATTILPWLWFNGSVNQSLGALRSNSRLITSIALPREIYPLAVVGEKFIEFLLSQPVVWIVAVIYGIAPSRYLWAFPLAIVLELVLIAGLALLMSALNTIVRDVQRGIGVALRMLFYLCPVLYPVSNIHSESLRRIYELNPLVGIFELDRAAWFPQYFGDWRAVYISIIGAAAALALGWFVFIRLERPVLKEL